MLEAFQNFIKKEKLILPEDRILLAVSGGVDSVAMVDLFSQSGFSFSLAHCNFGLRGSESDKDELFVQQLAKKYNVLCFSTQFDTKNFSKKNKLTIQEAARTLRYTWFEELSKKHNLNCIATAHHLNDSIETFFINLIRGTGIEGLKGIPVKNEKIIRPLLFASRQEIEHHAKKRKLKWREDSSNLKDDYLRNKIRHHLVPLLKEFNPQFETTMQQNMSHLKLASQIFSKEVLKTFSRLFEEENKTFKASINELESLPEPEEFLFYLLQPMNFNAETTKEILQHHQSGKMFYSNTHRLTIDRNTIIIEEKKIEPGSVLSIEEGQKNFSNRDIHLDFFYILRTAAKAGIPDAPHVHWLNASELKFPLQVRRWKQGDSFIPLGMKGKKKVSDFLIDKKIPLPEKEKTYVILSGKQIVCILGHRIDERFKMANETKKIFCIEYRKQ